MIIGDRMCPVCGFEMADGPHDFNICPSCGTEFGLHDENSSIQDLREVWIASGPSWRSGVIDKPQGWNPWWQLLRAIQTGQTDQGLSYRTTAFVGSQAANQAIDGDHIYG